MERKAVIEANIKKLNGDSTFRLSWAIQNGQFKQVNIDLKSLPVAGYLKKRTSDASYMDLDKTGMNELKPVHRPQQKFCFYQPGLMI